MATDPLILELRRIKHLRHAATAAQAAATKATEPAIVAALQAGISPSQIAAESGVSDSHVRAVRRQHGIPANPSYAHLRPAAVHAALDATETQVETDLEGPMVVSVPVLDDPDCLNPEAGN
jgi:hypothetical protein